MQSTVKRIWAKKGEPLSVKVKQGYKSFYTYSCVSPHTGEYFSLFLPEVNTLMMNVFFREFYKEFSDKNVLIIMDQAGWHKSKELQKPANIKIDFLPPYSPELNPVEKLWQWLKKETIHNHLFDTIEELADALAMEINKLTEYDYKRLCNCSYM